jgi:hypothetical protein
MRIKLPLLIATATLFVAFPILAQSKGGPNGNHGQGNNGHHNGNNSNHSGHDDDGNSAGHRQDRPHGFGDHDLVLGSQAQTNAVAEAVTAATASLQSRSLTSSSGAVLPAAAQDNAFAALSAGDANADDAEKMVEALAVAGPTANAMVPTLVRNFAALRTTPAILPSVVADFNTFTKAASNQFIANPPAEFVAMRSVLGQLTSAAAAAK